jgi:hypothetical protein
MGSRQCFTETISPTVGKIPSPRLLWRTPHDPWSVISLTQRLSRKVLHDLEPVKDRLYDHHALCTTISRSGLSTNALGPTRGPM